MRSTWKLGTEEGRQLTLTRLAAMAAGSLALAMGLAACEHVSGFTQPSLVRAIDASFIAPAVNISVEGLALASNIGEGTITSYGTIPASNAAKVSVTATTGGKALVSASATFLAGRQHSVFLTDNGAAPTSYTVTVLEDQQTPAAGGHSAFRFLNQAPRTGAVDVYFLPAGTTLAQSNGPFATVQVGAINGYQSFQSQTVTMIITPTGLLTPKYTSQSLSLVGGEVRTVVIVDSQLTSNPPVSVVITSDVN